MWNLGEPITSKSTNPYVENLGVPELFRVEAVCGTLGHLVRGFGRLPPNHPEVFLEEPQAFQAVGEKTRPVRQLTKA